MSKLMERYEKFYHDYTNRDLTQDGPIQIILTLITLLGILYLKYFKYSNKNRNRIKSKDNKNTIELNGKILSFNKQIVRLLMEITNHCESLVSNKDPKPLIFHWDENNLLQWGVIENEDENIRNKRQTKIIELKKKLLKFKHQEFQFQSDNLENLKLNYSGTKNISNLESACIQLEWIRNTFELWIYGNKDKEEPNKILEILEEFYTTLSKELLTLKLNTRHNEQEDDSNNERDNDIMPNREMRLLSQNDDEDDSKDDEKEKPNPVRENPNEERYDLLRVMLNDSVNEDTRFRRRVNHDNDLKYLQIMRNSYLKRNEIDSGGVLSRTRRIEERQRYYLIIKFRRKSREFSGIYLDTHRLLMDLFSSQEDKAIKDKIKEDLDKFKEALIPILNNIDRIVNAYEWNPSSITNQEIIEVFHELHRIEISEELSNMRKYITEYFSQDEKMGRERSIRSSEDEEKNEEDEEKKDEFEDEEWSDEDNDEVEEEILRDNYRSMLIRIAEMMDLIYHHQKKLQSLQIKNKETIAYEWYLKKIFKDKDNNGWLVWISNFLSKINSNKRKEVKKGKEKKVKKRKKIKKGEEIKKWDISELRENIHLKLLEKLLDMHLYRNALYQSHHILDCAMIQFGSQIRKVQDEMDKINLYYESHLKRIHDIKESSIDTDNVKEKTKDIKSIISELLPVVNDSEDMPNTIVAAENKMRGRYLLKFDILRRLLPGKDLYRYLFLMQYQWIFLIHELMRECHGIVTRKGYGGRFPFHWNGRGILRRGTDPEWNEEAVNELNRKLMESNQEKGLLGIERVNDRDNPKLHYYRLSYLGNTMDREDAFKDANLLGFQVDWLIGMLRLTFPDYPITNGRNETDLTDTIFLLSTIPYEVKNCLRHISIGLEPHDPSLYESWEMEFSSNRWAKDEGKESLFRISWYGNKGKDGVSKENKYNLYRIRTDQLSVRLKGIRDEHDRYSRIEDILLKFYKDIMKNYGVLMDNVVRGLEELLKFASGCNERSWAYRIDQYGAKVDGLMGIMNELEDYRDEHFSASGYSLFRYGMDKGIVSRRQWIEDHDKRFKELLSKNSQERKGFLKNIKFNDCRANEKNTWRYALAIDLIDDDINEINELRINDLDHPNVHFSMYRYAMMIKCAEDDMANVETCRDDYLSIKQHDNANDSLAEMEELD